MDSKNCIQCGKEFFKNIKRGDKYFAVRKFCCNKCMFENHRNRIKKNCLVCGKDMLVIPAEHNNGLGKYCSRECYNTVISERMIGPKHHNWKGGRYKDAKGYLRVLDKSNINADSDGYVLEHRLIVENKLGRQLSNDETIHHIDFIKDNNDISNLYLFKTSGEHTKYHWTIDKLKLISNL